MRRVVVAILLAARGAAAEPVDQVPPARATPAIRGRVVDASGHPIRGAIVAVDLDTAQSRSATTDAGGHYAIVGATVGTTIVVVCDGYAAGLATASERVDDIVLVPDTSGETITLTGEAPPPVQGAGKLSRADLERLPGAGNDPIRALDAMPGVVNFPLPLADSGLAIRGSSPQDSKILVDDFEIPMLYHNIGFRSIVPAEAIDHLDYIPGGFDVAFGGATSGIVDVATRAGDAHGNQQAELSSADGSVLAQGQTHDGAYLLAFRRSVIDQLLPALLPADLDLSLTTVPRYYDGQLRLDYAPTRKWALRLSGVGSDDVLALYTSAIVDPSQRLYDRTRFLRLTGAARYHDGPWTVNLAVSGIAQQVVYERGVAQHLSMTQPGVTGRAEITRVLGSAAGLGDVTWRIGSELAVARSTIDLALPQATTEGQPPPPDDPMDTSQKFTGSIWTSDFAAWTAIGASLDPRIRLTTGLRVDAFQRSGDFALQPRSELTIKLSPVVTARLSAGAYVRPPEYQTELLYPALAPERATQLIGGVTVEPRDGMRIQSSVYYTDRNQLITSAGDQLTNTGRGTSYGAELLGTLHDGPWFGWLSYAYSHSTRIDVPGGPSRLFDYDQPHALNAAASYSFGRWQLGGRFRLYSGLPETPVLGSVFNSDTNVYTPIYGAVSSERAPLHHELDLRIDRHWRLGSMKMTYFLDVQNVYLDQSAVGYLYSFDYQQRTAFRALPILPSAGLRGEL